MMKHLSMHPALQLLATLLVHACGDSTAIDAQEARTDTIIQITNDTLSDRSINPGDTVAPPADLIDGSTDTSQDIGEATEDTATLEADTPVEPDSTSPADANSVFDSDTLEDIAIADIISNDTVASEDITNEPTDTGLEPLPDTAPPGPPPEWLLSIDNGTKVLQRVNITTGATTDLCDLYDPTLGAIPSYPSLTFSRNNFLYASRGGTALDLIDPCTCEIEQLGSYGGWSGVNGITSDKGIQLLGAAATQDELISIQTKTGVGTLIGDLGANFTTHGATWSDSINGLYAINGLNNGLYTIDPLTGLATFEVTLSMNFGTVGIELLPANGVIYACSSEANLLSIDPVSGVVTTIGSMNQSGACTNLAAPWKAVPCIEP